MARKLAFDLPDVRGMSDAELHRFAVVLYRAIQGTRPLVATCRQAAQSASRIERDRNTVQAGAWRTFMRALRARLEAVLPLLEDLPADIRAEQVERVIQISARALTAATRVIEAHAWKLFSQAIAKAIRLAFGRDADQLVLHLRSVESRYGWLEVRDDPLPVSCNPRTLSRRGPPPSVSAPAGA